MVIYRGQEYVNTPKTPYFVGPKDPPILWAPKTPCFMKRCKGLPSRGLYQRRPRRPATGWRTTRSKCHHGSRVGQCDNETPAAGP